MNRYSISVINPFLVSTKVSNNGVIIQHYSLLQTDRIHIVAYFPIEMLKAGNTLILPLFGFLPRFFGLLMPFIGLGVLWGVKRAWMSAFAFWYIQCTAKSNQKFSQMHCKRKVLKPLRCSKVFVWKRMLRYQRCYTKLQISESQKMAAILLQDEAANPKPQGSVS